MENEPSSKEWAEGTGIIRAAAGIKEVNVITVTSARKVVLLVLLFIR